MIREFTSKDGRHFKSLSNWLDVEYEFIGQRPYVKAFGGSCYLDEMILLNSTWSGGKPIVSEDNNITLSATYTWGLFGAYIELSDDFESVRMWREVES